MLILVYASACGGGQAIPGNEKGMSYAEGTEKSSKVSLSTESALLEPSGSKDTREAHRADDLVLALHGGEVGLREDAVEALADIGDEAAVRHLASALADPEVEVRAAAIEELARFESTAILLQPALYDADPDIREETIYALGEIGGVDAAALLHQALTDELAHLRETASDVLEECYAEGRC